MSEGYGTDSVLPQDVNNKVHAASLLIKEYQRLATTLSNLVEEAEEGEGDAELLQEYSEVKDEIRSKERTIDSALRQLKNSATTGRFSDSAGTNLRVLIKTSGDAFEMTKRSISKMARRAAVAMESIANQESEPLLQEQQAQFEQNELKLTYQ
ncbi:hypothetical protein KIPB_009228, partial [Kipferlia bialata]|eukprot:g6701.t1